MDTINKLQFRHANDIITASTMSGVTDAILDVLEQKWYDTLAWSDPVSPYRSLYGEPVVFKYALEGEDTNHLVLAIGVETNDTEASGEFKNNKFMFINIDKIDGDIEDIWEEIEKILKMIRITTLSSDTISLYSQSDENGTVISGDVNTVNYRINNNLPKPNKITVHGLDTQGLTNGTGIFMYVDLSYDKDTEILSFEVSDSTKIEGFDKKEIKIPNNYVTGGIYDIEKESIVLTMKESDPVVIDCEELINEWEVEGEASKTPIVLEKERVKGFDPLMHHAHSDILHADVRVDSGRSYNILEKSSNGRYLYVRGHADNIAYSWNGDKMTVNDALNDLKNIRISQDRSNMLQDRADGFFANTTLDFISSENQLVFRTTNVDGSIKEKILQLNSIEVPIDEIYYDSRTETLIIKWRDSKGEIQTIKIPIGDMIDEWEVLNPGHNVHLDKIRSVGGNDKLSADVNIYNGDNNILVDRDHSLYVKGTADNIKYKDTTVEAALDNLGSDIADEEARAKAAEQTLDTKIDQEIADRAADVDEEEARAKAAEDDLQAEIEAVSADSRASLKHVINEDNSIIVAERDGRDGKEAVVNVHLSEQDGNNTIRLKSDGLYNFVDLDYNPETNKIKLIKSTFSADTTVEKEIKLETISFIDEIKYDPDTEILTIVYYSGTEKKTVEINLKDLIEEWSVSATSTVTLFKDRVTSGGPDILTANVNICHHEDNAIEEHNDGLYVHNYSGEIADLGSRIDTVSGDVITETNRAQAAEQLLDDKITNEETRAKAAENVLHEDIVQLSASTRIAINAEETRAKQREDELEHLIGEETQRAIQADTLLQDAIDDEIVRSTEKDTIHDNKIAALEASANTLDRAVEDERTRAISAETEIRNDFTNAVHDEETRALLAENAIRTDLTNAISGETVRATLAEGALQIALNAEIERSTSKDNELVNAINTEKAAREAKDEELSAKIDAATLTFDDTKTIDLNKSTDNVVTANVKIANSDNNIIIHPEGTAYDGLFASATLEYEPTGNKIRLVTSNGAQEYIQLVGATLLDSIEYDPVNKMLIIKYTDGTGSKRETTVGVTDLWNDWIIQNPSEKSAVEMTKVIGDPGNPDTLSARVLITDDRDGDGKPDEGSDNLIEIRNNGLYVCGSGNTTAQCVSGRTDAIYKALFGSIAPGGCGEGIEYLPDTLSCVISGATSFAEADRMMAYQICEILEMWVSGMTCTSVSNWVDDGANKKMLVDVRPSHGNILNGMTDDDLYITDLTGDTIEHGVTEFTDTNALRIVCLEEGGGVIPDVTSPQNGIYLSNVWDCGKYYQESTEADEMAEVSADGYNVNYFTDESDEGKTADYSNYLRC